ncbi:MAG: hypothetical protein GY910_07565 [bacterium]|nr:hypothetical protein [Deltaproteobacteria bacterium]MCP4904822.1 hypothetical protein [bacterium]
MFLLREEHKVIGLKEEDFEETYRNEWLPALAKSEDARLLYFTHLAHGSGHSYRVVTYTLLRDGLAWGRLVDRVDRGDLKSLSEKLDESRYDVEAKPLLPLPWSKIQQIEIDEVPTEPGEHELSLFMEDTVWPFEGRFEEYVRRSGEQYSTEYDKSFPDTPKLLEIQSSFRTTYGSHQRQEVVLWQKVLRPEGLLHLITEEMPKSFKKPGRWMLDALSLRDQWQSRLLRTSSWSPRF